MGKMSWKYIVLGGLLAAVILLLPGFVSLLLFGGGHGAAGTEILGLHVEVTLGRAVMTSALFCLIDGIMVVWLYAAIRPRYGMGPKTAAIAGFAIWLVTAPVDVFWAGMGFVPTGSIVVPILVYLPTFIVATIAGAWLYKENEGTSGAPE